MAFICANYPVNTPSSLLSWDSTGTSQHHTLPKVHLLYSIQYTFCKVYLVHTEMLVYLKKNPKNQRLLRQRLKVEGEKKLKIASNNFSLNKYACFKIHLRVSDKEMRIPTSNSTQLLHQIALFSPTLPYYIQKQSGVMSTFFRECNGNGPVSLNLHSSCL